MLKVMKAEPGKSIGGSATLTGGEQRFLLQITRGGLGEDRGKEASKKISGYNGGTFEERQNGDLRERFESWHVPVRESIQ